MSVTVETITKDRFARWVPRFVESKATPILAIGVGHDENIGRIVITTLENEEITVQAIRLLLRDALRQLGDQ